MPMDQMLADGFPPCCKAGRLAWLCPYLSEMGTKEAQFVLSSFPSPHPLFLMAQTVIRLPALAHHVLRFLSIA